MLYWDELIFYNQLHITDQRIEGDLRIISRFLAIFILFLVFKIQFSAFMWAWSVFFEIQLEVPFQVDDDVQRHNELLETIRRSPSEVGDIVARRRKDFTKEFFVHLHTVAESYYDDPAEQNGKYASCLEFSSYFGLNLLWKFCLVICTKTLFPFCNIYMLEMLFPIY